MALQLYKDSSEISPNTLPNATAASIQSNGLSQEVVSTNNQEMRQHGNERKNLQALLNLTTSLQISEEQVHTTDKSVEQIGEDKRFLSEVLKSLSTDVVGNIKDLIESIIQFENKLNYEKEELESLLEKLLDHVCCIDMAKCFYQLDGLKAILPLLKHEEGTVRILGARVISECCQNNPFCQELTIGDDVFSSLIDIASQDENYTARFHAFSALSAIVRDNPKGLLQFRKYKGFNLLVDALKLHNSRITAKISFFITYLNELSSCEDDLIVAGIIPALVEVVPTSTDSNPVQALYSVMSYYPQAVVAEIQHYSPCRDYITRTLNENVGSEENLELVECCSKIAELLDGFPDHKTPKSKKK